jgi:hypothetical protein
MQERGESCDDGSKCRASRCAKGEALINKGFIDHHDQDRDGAELRLFESREQEQGCLQGQCDGDQARR